MPTTLISLLITVAALGQSSASPLPKQELDYQQQAFQQWWGQALELRLAELPEDGSVPDFRTPYSGFDYPDRAGGTVAAMSKYDRAFHSGRSLATEFERRDVGAHRSRRPGMAGPDGFEMRRGLFGRLRMVRVRGPNTPAWYGHCNGWTAAAIRHAEPQFNVVRNGVVFTPADIKGLLAEIYMYTDTEFLGGIDSVIHPAVFHLSLTNWLGRGDHPIGMEAAVGEVVVNYPIYSYKSTVTKRADNRAAEVKLTVTYAMNTNGEAVRSPRINKQMYFHYLLDLNERGEIVGGRYFGDSARIDMLWAPLQPIQGGKKGNERGNPHVDVKTVLALWRESVPEELRQKWLNIDPPVEDRVLLPEEKPADSLATSPPTTPPAPATVSPATAPSPAADASATAASPPPAEPAPAASTTASETPPSPMPSSPNPPSTGADGGTAAAPSTPAVP